MFRCVPRAGVMWGVPRLHDTGTPSLLSPMDTPQVDDASLSAEFPVVLCRTADPTGSRAADPSLSLRVRAAPLPPGVLSAGGGWHAFQLREVRGSILPLRLCVSATFVVSAYDLACAFGALAQGTPAPLPEEAAAGSGAEGGGLRLTDPLAPTGGLPRTRTSLSLDSESRAAAQALGDALLPCVRALVASSGSSSGGGSVDADSSETALRTLLHSQAAPLFVEAWQPLGESVEAVVDLRNSPGSGIERLLGSAPAAVRLAVAAFSGLTVEAARLQFRFDGQQDVVRMRGELLRDTLAAISEQGTRQMFHVLGAVKGFGAPAAILEVRVGGTPDALFTLHLLLPPYSPFTRARLARPTACPASTSRA